MKNILIKSGAEFIGSHVLRCFVNKYTDYNIFNLDALTYAGNLENLKLEVGIMTRGKAWLDTGTVDSIDDATEFVRVMEKRTDKKIACTEEIAYLHKFINKEQALLAENRYGKSGYGRYIKKIVQ